MKDSDLLQSGDLVYRVVAEDTEVDAWRVMSRRVAVVIGRQFSLDAHFPRWPASRGLIDLTKVAPASRGMIDVSKVGYQVFRSARDALTNFESSNHHVLAGAYAAAEEAKRALIWVGMMSLTPR